MAARAARGVQRLPALAALRIVTAMPAEQAPRRGAVVVVLGMHRSGTSLAAKAINVLGVELGNDLWGPREEDNPTGFWEDRDVVALNKRLLERAGMAWNSLVPAQDGTWTAAPFEALKQEGVALVHERLSRYSTWGFKDPRAARVLPFWKDIFRTLGITVTYILTVRNPVNVAGSLQQRDGLPELHSHILWLEHMYWALAGTAGEKRCFVDYDELVEQPVAQLHRLARELGIDITAGITAGIAGFADGFVTDSLRHNRAAPDAGDPRAPEIAARLYSLLRDAALGKRGERALAGELEKIDRQLREWKPVCDALDQTEARLVAAGGAIVERDFWLGELRSQVTRLGEEKSEIEQIVREHGARLQDFYAQIVKLDEQKGELEVMVRARGAQLVAMNAELTEVSARLAQRDSELSRIRKHWYWRIARLFIR